MSARSDYFLSAADNGLANLDVPMMGLIFDTPRASAHLATAYGAAGLDAPRLTPEGLFEIGDAASVTPRQVATDLVSAAVGADPSAYAGLVEDAMNDMLKRQAWADIRPELERSLQAVARERFAEIRPAIVSDLAPATKRALSDLTKAVAKLDGVDPLDFDAVVAAKGDVLAVHATIGALVTLGALSAAYPLSNQRDNRFFPDQLAAVLHLVKLETPTTDLLITFDGRSREIVAPEADDVVRSVWEVNHAMNHYSVMGVPSPELIGTDDLLIRLARGDYPGLTLDAAPDQAEVARRRAYLDTATTPVRVGRRRPVDPWTKA